MQQAWTQERFSYEGKYYTFRDVCLIPSRTRNRIPLRYAATTRDSFAAMGELGLPIFAGLGGAAVPSWRVPLPCTEKPGARLAILVTAT